MTYTVDAHHPNRLGLRGLTPSKVVGHAFHFLEIGKGATGHAPCLLPLVVDVETERNGVQSLQNGLQRRFEARVDPCQRNGEFGRDLGRRERRMGSMENRSRGQDLGGTGNGRVTAG